MKQRIITGVLAAALFLPIVIIGGNLFTLLVMLLAVIGIFELLRMRKISFFSSPGLLSIILTMIVVIPDHWLSVFTFNDFTRFDWFLLGLLLLLSLTVITKNRFSFDEVSFVLLTVLYVGFGFFYLNETRLLSNGLQLLFFILFLIWATDSGAYFIGRSFGKRKLWPKISPNKTIEGAVGGIMCAVIVGLVFQLFLPIYDYQSIIIIAVVTAVFGQVGDLVQSAFKRHYGVKDSGKILPGHGGILDRFDSLIFVLPILHLLQLL
ncbi:phosphatidate cytidylyltransferase [Bacillus taeanensis]|uniref:Phosphatidate cytidylyltransferase n=1 Tax=Bacillus taeanensis TaxID=273032 RepID=A0A366XVF3_9BACI|nr:phosphatidate cytidylyltransferase [Bacillus taeanensis]RBW69877.1 phosphatidate cytidylyltransferase [Bacillus taeanensis]